MTELTENPEQLRKRVSAAYTRGVRALTCCGPATSCCGPKTEAPTSGLASLAGYAAELQDLPEGVAETSFGCGNPLSFAEVQPGQTVLDLGSGTGLDLLVAAKKVGPEGKVIGVDMTDAMLEQARKNLDSAGASNVELRKGVIEALPVADGEVDWVISNCVINLSPEKDRVYQEITRVLKPGGVMLISDIVADDLPEEAKASFALYAGCVAGAISEADYQQGLSAAGLTDIEVIERHVYQLEELGGLADGCCGPMGNNPVPSEALKPLVGKVASVRIRAVKPSSL